MKALARLSFWDVETFNQRTSLLVAAVEKWAKSDGLVPVMKAPSSRDGPPILDSQIPATASKTTTICLGLSYKNFITV